MRTVLKPLILTVILVCWVAYMPFLPEVVPFLLKQTITLIFGVALIWYFANWNDGNWG